MTTTSTHTIRCGNCRQSHPTASAVRACYSMAANAAWGLEPEQPVEPNTDMPVALDTSSAKIPDSKYAIEEDGLVKFYEVDTGREGTRWEGRRFVTRLIGAPGAWHEYPERGPARDALFAKINADVYTDPTSGETLHGPKAAAVRYSREFTVCARCGSPLSDEASRARGLGPICVGYF